MALFGAGYMREKYEKIKCGSERERLACVDFGLHALITDSILTALNVLAAVLLFATDVFGGLAGAYKGAASIIFAVLTAAYACAGVSYIKWQKDLNARPVWIAAAVVFAAAIASSVALAVAGGVLSF